MTDQQQPERRGGGATADVYEPWHPRVGDRVRVRVSSECQFWAHQHGYGSEPGYEDGATATVTRLVPLDCNEGHGYEVTFDEPWPHPPGETYPKLVGSVYAAIELEPLDRGALAEAGRHGGEGRE